ncbi:ATP-binding protein [Cohnella silvisoli]|uniref:histidine kinase n=1 Tax=Cohnella silvisoli TaxID=2873699 RepID=A0ABV1KQ91_9BACL|nr:sensor histidine kinase [Cohnella silvisoli]MCD9022077.1 sensor histidine kinase [Cohnella silvisoli]
MRLQTRLILLIGALLFIIISGLAFTFERLLETTLKGHIGSSALKIAKTVASMQVIKDAFSEPDPSKIIQPIAETIRIETDAEFIVVGNLDEIRYSHPVPSQIGKEMVGGDNGPVLQGQSIISEAVGSLGLSLRGKAPIFDNNKQVIGIVSVGFLVEDINKTAVAYRNNLILLAAIAIMIGSGGAIFIANGVKRSIFGLEPKEIGLLYQEKKAILESIHEGIIAINKEGSITLANQAALKLLSPHEEMDISGKPILDVLPESRLLEVMNTGAAEFDKEMIINDSLVVVNRLPILNHQQQVIGAVSSFRNKSELLRLTEELSQVKRYAEALRAQTHEYSNKLYTIYGLIQLESYQEAMDLITHETDVHQGLIHFLMKEIPDPILGGILIGKFNRANELKVQLEIDQESTFRDVPHSVSRNHLVTIIGNLIDNSFDAVLAADRETRKVKLFMTDLGDDLIIEVEDNGVGIPPEAEDRIFEVGFSTKNGTEGGFGLALVKQAVQQLNGYITFQAHPHGGTIFTVAIPKGRK